MAKLLKWIVNIILLCSIVVAGGLLIPPLSGVTTVMVDEVDMKTNLSNGSVAYAKEVPLSELEVGDEILVDKEGKFVYRVKNIDASEGVCKLEDTRTPNSESFTDTFRDSVEKVILIVPFIGYIPMAMKSTEGLIVIGLAVVFVVILFILAELWRPDEDEDEEEEEEQAEQPMPERAPIPVDVSSIIMEEVSNEIASAVSSVVAEGQREAEKEDQTVERAILNYEDFLEDECEADIEETDVLEETVEAVEELTETEDVTEEVAEEEMVLEEMIPEVRELAMPLYTAQELIIKAKEKGEEPEIIQDEDTGVTILDYSNLL